MSSAANDQVRRQNDPSEQGEPTHRFEAHRYRHPKGPTPAESCGRGALRRSPHFFSARFPWTRVMTWNTTAQARRRSAGWIQGAIGVVLLLVVALPQQSRR
jgi:hypothetical protein